MIGKNLRKNVTNVLNVLYAKRRKNISSNRGKQVTLLIIPNGEKRETKSEERWHYLAVKNYEHY